MPDGVSGSDDRDKKVEKASQGESYWPWYLNKLARERKERELAEFGEDGIVEKKRAIAATVSILMERVEPLVEEARRRNFPYFHCALNHQTLNSGIRLQFADGKGQYFERRLALNKLMNSQMRYPSIPEYWDVVDAVHNAVRGDRGFQMLSSWMRRQRVKLPPHLLK